MLNKVLIIGIGDLGGWVLEFLARVKGINEIIAADVDTEKGSKKANLVSIGAAQMGFYPKITYQHIDLNNIEETAKTLQQINPDVICNSTTLQSWWVLHTIKEEIANKIRSGAGLGPWIPVHAVLTYKLMKAVREANVKSIVINGSYPDGTNVILSRVGLAPTIGMGNIENLIPRIQRAVSIKLNKPMKNIEVFFVGHHFHVIALLTTGSALGAPYYLKILVEGNDIKKVISDDEIFSSIPKIVATPSGAPSHPIVAAGFVRNITAAVLDNDDIFHAPGPLGLPGGFPVRFESKIPKIVLPDDLSLDDAVNINLKAQKFDGIEKIDDKGTIIITDQALVTMKKYLNYNRKRVTVDELEDAANELRSKFAEAGKRYPRS